MPKINGNQIAPGAVIEHDGGLWVAVKTNAVKPGKGGAFNQVELKNLIDGRKLNERFRADETVEAIDLELKDFSFLYAEATPWSSWTSKATSRSNSPRTGSASARPFCRMA
jgi:elongation factor P